MSPLHKKKQATDLSRAKKQRQPRTALTFTFDEAEYCNVDGTVESYQVLNLDGAPIDDYVINFDPSTGKTGIEWLDQYLARLETALEQRRFLAAFCRMCLLASHDDFNDSRYLEALAHAPCERLVRVNSIIEAGMLIMFQFFVRFEHARLKNCWVVVDLPPGVGKSYEIERLCPLFAEFYRRRFNDNYERVLITTPTAKTRNAYSFARILHSQMGLPIRKPNCDNRHYAAAISEALEKPCKIAPPFLLLLSPISISSITLDIANRINLGRVFIFDEMSMYGQDLLVPVLNKLREKFCILIGDAYQLPPVMGTAINWDLDSDFYKQFPIAHKCENTPQIRIVRFEKYLHVDQQKSLRQLLLNLRQVIAQQVRAKMTTGKNASSKIKEEWLAMWYNKICRSVNVENELSLANALESLVESQKFVNTMIAWLRHGDNFYERLADNLADLPTILASVSKRISERFCEIQLPVVIGYENSFNFEVFDHIVARDLIDRGKTSQNCWRSGAGCVIRNVLMFEADADQKQAEYVQNNVPSNLMNARNTFFPGMFIRCRENDSSQGTYNGQVGIFVGFFYDDGDHEPEDRPVFDRMHIAKLAQPSARQRQQQLVADELTVVKFRHRLVPNASLLARSLHMVFYDVETKCLKSCAPAVRHLCEQCERARRNEVQSSSRAPCTYHPPGGGRRPVQYLCFSWTSNYAQTVFCVQGATLANEKMFLLGDTVLKNNILRTLYVVLSRCRSSDQVYVDKKFVLKALRAIFNQPVAILAEKLEQITSRPKEDQEIN